MKKYAALSEAIDYFEDMGEKIYELEKMVKEIKDSKDFKKHANTLRVYASRKLIDKAPAYKNGYSVPTKISLDDGIHELKRFLQEKLDKKDKL